MSSTPTPILGRGPFYFAVVEATAQPLPSAPSIGVLDPDWHAKQLAEVVAKTPVDRPARLPLPPRNAPLTDNERTWVESYVHQLANGFRTIEFEELLHLAPDRALAVFADLEHGPLTADVAPLRTHRAPGALEAHLRDLGLIDGPSLRAERIATVSEILLAHDRAASFQLRRDSDHPIVVRAMSDLARRAGLFDIYLEETEDDDGTITVHAYSNARRYELVVQPETSWAEAIDIVAFLNTIIRDRGEDIVFVSLSHDVFTWGSRTVLLRAARTGLFGFDGKVDWNEFAPRFPRDETEEDNAVAGELTPSMIEIVARHSKRDAATLITELEQVAAAAAVRANRDWPASIEISGLYSPERATIDLHAIALVADPPNARNEVSLARGKELSEEAEVGDELAMVLWHASDWWFEFAHQPMTDAAERAVGARLADLYLPSAILLAGDLMG